MATVIRLNNANFDNPNLPVFFPVEAEGLIAGYTFDGRISTLAGGQLSITGNPILDESGITINSATDIITTNVVDAEHEELTVFMVGKRVATPAVNSFMVGTYTDGFTVYSQAGKLIIWGKDSVDGSAVQPSTLAFDVDSPFLSVSQRSQNMVMLSVPGLNMVASKTSENPISKSMDKIRLGESQVGREPIIHVSALLIYNKLLDEQTISKVNSQLRSYFSPLSINVQ
ncbi:hypothetical protein WKI32_11445 [Vibrio alginolyticus]